MKFLGRLKYYLGGFFIGAIMVYFMFGTRGCDWTPTNRVQSAFKACDVLISEQKRCEMKCHNLDEKIIFDLIYNGKVNFKDSRTNTDIKNYILYNKTHKVGFDLNLRDSVAVVTDFYNVDGSCQCDTLSEKLSVLMLPKEMIFSQMKENGIEFLDKNRCEFSCYGISENDVLQVFEDGEIDYSQSVPDRKPNAGYAITKTINGNNYLFAVEMGYKTRITKIIRIGDTLVCDC